MMASLLARLLWHANADPPIIRRKEFYAVKERILRRWGTRAGEDLQHIRKDCWGYRGQGCDEDCEKCGGTGVFREFWVLLQRWRMGGYVFHIPVQRSEVRPTAHPTIEGYVRHAERDHGLAHEAALWLFLLFDRRTFWRLMTATRIMRPRWLPLTRLQAVAFEVRMWFGQFHLKRCRSCGRWTFRMIRAIVFSLQCRRCQQLERMRYEMAAYFDTWRSGAIPDIDPPDGAPF